jgi:hypothetical protein
MMLHVRVNCELAQLATYILDGMSLHSELALTQLVCVCYDIYFALYVRICMMYLWSGMMIRYVGADTDMSNDFYVD